MYTFNLSTWQTEDGGLCEFEDNLVYRSQDSQGYTEKQCFSSPPPQQTPKVHWGEEQEFLFGTVVLNLPNAATL